MIYLLPSASGFLYFLLIHYNINKSGIWQGKICVSLDQFMRGALQIAQTPDHKSMGDSLGECVQSPTTKPTFQTRPNSEFQPLAYNTNMGRELWIFENSNKHFW
jgi:hypothetical protein